MQEHVELEVSLEIIMAQIAQAIFKLEKENNLDNKTRLDKLLCLQDEAYKGNREAVKQILAGGF